MLFGGLVYDCVCLLVDRLKLWLVCGGLAVYSYVLGVCVVLVGVVVGVYCRCFLLIVGIFCWVYYCGCFVCWLFWFLSFSVLYCGCWCLLCFIRCWDCY